MRNEILITYTYRVPTVDIIYSQINRCCGMRSLVIEKRVWDVKANDIASSDVIIAIRPFEKEIYRLICAGKKAGKTVIVYLDDDLLNIPNFYASSLRGILARVMYKNNCLYLQKSINNCDVLWGSNPDLVKDYSQYVSNGKSVCIDALFELDNVRKPLRRVGNQTKLLFAGSGDHVGYINHYVVPALNELYKDNFNVKLICIGLESKMIDHCMFPVQCIPWFSDISRYYSYLEEENFDIGLAPLEIGGFYEKKYYNKFLEYTRLGIIGLYSNQQPYTLVVKDKYNGLLADPTVENWKEKIQFAIENSDICLNCVSNAQLYCENNFSDDVIQKKFENNMSEIFNKTEYKTVDYIPDVFMNNLKKIASFLLEWYEKSRS